MDTDSKPEKLKGTILIDDLEDFAVLFQPFTGETMGLNQTALFIWKNIDGEKSLREIATLLSREFNISVESAINDLLSFTKKLYRRFFIVKDSGEQIEK